MGYGCPHPVYAHPGSLSGRVSRGQGHQCYAGRYHRPGVRLVILPSPLASRSVAKISRITAIAPPASGHALPTPPPTRSGAGLGKGKLENAGWRDCTRAEVACTQQTPLRYAHVTYETTRDVVGIRQLPPESAVRRHRRATDQSRSEYQRVCCLCLPPAGSPVCGRERAARQRQRWSPLSRYTRSWS